MEKEKEQTKPTEGKENIQTRLTYDPEYIKDREKIDALSRSIHNQIGQLNKHLKMIQITEYNFKISEPTEQAKKAKTVKAKTKRFLKWWGL